MRCWESSPQHVSRQELLELGEEHECNAKFDNITEHVALAQVAANGRDHIILQNGSPTYYTVERACSVFCIKAERTGPPIYIVRTNEIATFVKGDKLILASDHFAPVFQSSREPLRELCYPRGRAFPGKPASEIPRAKQSRPPRHPPGYGQRRILTRAMARRAQQKKLKGKKLFKRGRVHRNRTDATEDGPVAWNWGIGGAVNPVSEVTKKPYAPRTTAGAPEGPGASQAQIYQVRINVRVHLTFTPVNWQLGNLSPPLQPICPGIG